MDLRDFSCVSVSTKSDSTKSGFGEFDGSLMLSNGTTEGAPLYLEGNYTAADLTANHVFLSDGLEISNTGAFGTDVSWTARERGRGKSLAASTLTP